MNASNIELAIDILPLELCNTWLMVFASLFFALIIGIPLGIALTNKIIHKTLEAIVNIGRSFPFAILMVALIPFTRFITGTSLGTTASIVPLAIAAIPYVARLIEIALKEVDLHILEAVVVMGSTPWQIITKVLLKEALPSIIGAATLTAINLIGYSAMAGLVGGGGLGAVAIQYGYYRFNTFMMGSTILLLILLVQLIQWAGKALSRIILKKRGKIFHV